MADNPFDPKYAGGLLGLLGKPPEPENSLARAFGLLASQRPAARTNPFSAAFSDLFPSSSAAPTQGAAHDLLGPGALSPLLGHNQPPQQHLWYYVTPRFNAFLSNLAVSEQHREAGLKKFDNVVASLNRHYYDHSSDTLNGIVIGSWGKKTQIAPPRDVDTLFLLPDHVYHRFQQRSGNRQSQLLQEVKDALLVTNTRTNMRADRQVVVVPFDAVTVEVAVGFRCADGSI